MAIRPIDGDELLGITRLLDTDAVRQSKTASWLLDQVLHDIQAMPTLTPPNEWVSVEEKLPENDGWYLVYAPGYWGNSKIYGLDGLAYSNFKHNYKVHWGIERGTGRGWPGIVTHWTNLPAPPDRRPPEGEA